MGDESHWAGTSGGDRLHSARRDRRRQAEEEEKEEEEAEAGESEKDGKG